MSIRQWVYPMTLFNSKMKFLLGWKRQLYSGIYSGDFRKLRGIDIKDTIYGITSLNEILYIAGGNKIIKIVNTGHILQTYYLDGVNTDHIIATNVGLIVCSDWCLETVTAMREEGQVVWEYKSPALIATRIGDWPLGEYLLSRYRQQ